VWWKRTDCCEGTFGNRERLRIIPVFDKGKVINVSLGILIEINITECDARSLLFYILVDTAFLRTCQ